MFLIDLYSCCAYGILQKPISPVGNWHTSSWHSFTQVADYLLHQNIISEPIFLITFRNVFIRIHPNIYKGPSC